MTEARKDYRCDFCGEVIPKKSEYVNQRLAPWDGRNETFGTWRSHVRCREVFHLAAKDYDYDWEPDVSEFKELLKQHAEVNPDD